MYTLLSILTQDTSTARFTEQRRESTVMQQWMGLRQHQLVVQTGGWLGPSDFLSCDNRESREAHYGTRGRVGGITTHDLASQKNPQGSMTHHYVALWRAGSLYNVLHTCVRFVLAFTAQVHVQVHVLCVRWYTELYLCMLSFGSIHSSMCTVYVL